MNYDTNNDRKFTSYGIKESISLYIYIFVKGDTLDEVRKAKYNRVTVHYLSKLLSNGSLQIDYYHNFCGRAAAGITNTQHKQFTTNDHAPGCYV